MLSKVKIFYILVFITCILFLWVYIPKWFGDSDFLLLTTFHIHTNKNNHDTEKIVAVDETLHNKKSFRDHEEESVIKNIKENERQLHDLEDRLALEMKEQEQNVVFDDKKEEEEINNSVEENNKKEINKNEDINKDNLVENTQLNQTDVKNNTIIITDNKDKKSKFCHRRGKNLVGPMFVDQALVKDIRELERSLAVAYGGSVEKGGWFSPTDCTPRVKTAIIIPYRNRMEQLKIFLRHMHPMLQRQKIYYRIIVVEQLFDDPFNRAALFNVGFVEASKFADFNCFIFTDVDLLPEDDRNYYGCPTSPRHMSVAVDKFNYQLPYEAIFGGCGSFKKDDFESINGMSNLFWGWGGEDDDLYKRIVTRGFQLSRPAMRVGRYTMVQIQHYQSSKADPNRMNLLQTSEQRMEFDGLNTLKYTLKEIVEEPLVTFVKVEMKKSMYGI